jgi:glycosyltransferase involved in cell wall biosynthesis
MPPRRWLLTTDTVGGVWTYSIELARGLTALGGDVVLVTTGPAPTAAQIDVLTAIPGVLPVITDLPLDWLAESEGQLLGAGEALAELVRTAAADLGVEGVQLHAPALAARADFPVPVVSVVHSCVATWWAAVRGGPLPDDLAWQARLTGDGLARSNRIVVPTAAFAAAVRSAYRLPHAPVAVHNGRAARSGTSQPWRDSVLTVGRLWDEGKGAAVFDAAAAVSSIPFEAAGPLIGPNGSMVALHHAKALGTLSQDALADRLAGRPIFASPGRYEPFGLAVLEAAAAQCALVLADIPTLRELWDGAATFVPAGNPEALAAAAEALIARPELRAAQGAAAAERATRYTPEATAKAMAALHASTSANRQQRAA